MSLAQTLFPEFDHEMASTRKSLERVPEDRMDWRPHPKSFTMQALAAHIAICPSWLPMTLQTDNLDVAPVGQPPMKPPELKTRAEMLEAFDRGVAEARAALGAVTDEALRQPWSLLSGGKPIFTETRAEVVRGMIMNHLIHHRAQLGVYLRLCDIPVPAIYGPSADES